ncbi:hypothetical protein SLS62_004119 [Diatrype stigma]|uniref:Glucose-methanol-choline oxidoreductase N-terminal domain-containing protein n=1 Tax=Diatrype stigma TaxID=117547 RepID=A0AAN9US09_9PEZI
MAANETFDFIIVGGGLAGLVLAARISENPHVSVLVIEAGSDQSGDPRVTTPAMWPTLLESSSAWKFQTVPQEALGGREIMFSQGRLLGGSSALNGLSFSATSKANVDAWEKLGNPGWGWSNFSRAVGKSYKLTTMPSGKAEGHGPLQLTLPEETTEWPRTWRETMTTLGFSAANDPFSGQVCGVLPVPDSIDPLTAQRTFSSNSYLEPAKSRPNLTVWTQTPVTKILFEEKEQVTATGVQYTTESGTKTVSALKEVILTAGTINTPRLLELSGVGDKGLLDSLGIKVVIDNPHVGENLQNHPMCGLSFEVLGHEGFETLDRLLRSEPEALEAAQEDYTKKTGPFAQTGRNTAAHLPLPGIRTNEGAKQLQKLLENLRTEHHVGKGTLDPDGSKPAALEGSEDYFSIILLLAHPLSRGSTHIISASPSLAASSAGLAVNPRYLEDPLDLEVLARHLQFVETIASTEPLSNHLKLGGKRGPGAPSPGSLTNLDTAKEYVRRSRIERKRSPEWAFSVPFKT